MGKEQFREKDNAKKIAQIRFGVFSAQEMQRLSAIQLTNSDVYTQPERSPAMGGPLDGRLGTSNKKQTCSTCGLKMAECAGHFGHIQLNLPVFHVGYFKAVLSVLQRICKSCSRVLMPEADIEFYSRKMRVPNLETLRRKDLNKQITDRTRKPQECPHCGAYNGAVKKVGTLKIVHDKYLDKNKRPNELGTAFRETFKTACEYVKELNPLLEANRAQDELNPLKVRQLFERVLFSDLAVLDLDPSFGRPEHLILTHLLVPPVCIRPSVQMDSTGGSNEDDLTMSLAEIIMVNNVLQSHLESGAKTQQIIEEWEFLQLKAALYINAELTGLPRENQPAKPQRGLCQRLKGKTGRFRQNLSGKRVDFSSRTVISPDPNLSIDQVGIPRYVAMELTFPQRVFEGNIAFLRQLVVNGPNEHPGANFVEFARSKTKKFLKYGDRNKIAKDLRPGDIVERHLVDGDIVLFNRQPSLHKISIMSHFVKVLPWRTFRFNECVCAPYNADFDGDEMNLHVPQTEEARAEALILMGTKSNICTPRNGEPLIAATQDFVTGAYLLTSKDSFFNRAEVCQFANWFGNGELMIDLPPPCILKPIRLWSGKQLFSLLIRPSRDSTRVINLETSNRNYYQKKVDKDSDTARRYGFPIRSMCPEDGYVIIRNSVILCGQMDKAILGGGSKKTVFYYLLRDCGEQAAADAMVAMSKLTTYYLTTAGFSIGIGDVTASEELSSYKRKLVDEGYGKCEELIGLFKEGRLQTQPGCTAEATLEAKITHELSEIRESAGHLCRNQLPLSNAPLIMARCGSKGSNINMSQMIACVGQQTISGARIPNGFEDRALPHYERHSKLPAAKGFVANSFYTGLTPTEFWFHTMGGREGLVDTAVKTAETGYMQRRLMKALEDLCSNYDVTVRNSAGTLIQFRYGEDGLDPVGMEGSGQPVALEHLLDHVIAAVDDPSGAALLPFELNGMTKEVLESEVFAPVRRHRQAEEEGLSRHFFLASVEELIAAKAERLSQIREDFGLSACREPPKPRNRTSTPETMANQVFRITRAQLERFLEMCAAKFQCAVIEPGTAVGAIGAQSIGEPGTQMTLKTFHFAGVAAMNVTLGVPRIKEIINASKNISTPVISAELETDDSEVSARFTQARVQKTELGRICKSITETYDENGVFLLVHLDRERISRMYLGVDPHVVRNALLASKLKLKPKDVSILSRSVLSVCPPLVERPNKVPQNPFFALQGLKRALPLVVVQGTPSVSRAVINMDGKKYKLLVEGTDLRAVMTTPGVLGTHATSNHVMEVEKTLGIEAARQSIIHEITYTMSEHGLEIDSRHVMLLADLMTFKGEVLGITRFGIAKMKSSHLMLASFEKTTDYLFDAALHGAQDPIDGVSECIIMGIPMNLGTGLLKLLHDTERKQPTPRQLVFDQPHLHQSIFAEGT